jgi:hypothetical protein
MAAMIVTCGTLLASIFASDFYLGESHNAVEMHKTIKFRNKAETALKVVAAKAKEAEQRIKDQLKAAK